MKLHFLILNQLKNRLSFDHQFSEVLSVIGMIRLEVWLFRNRLVTGVPVTIMVLRINT